MTKAIRILVYTCAALAASMRGDDFRFDSIGGRYGVSVTPVDNHFEQAECYVNWRLPFHWTPGTNWTLQPLLSYTAGWLHQGHDDAFITSIGPALSLRRKNLPFALLAGSSPTILTHTAFESKFFGIPFQFTEYIGLNWEPGSHFELGYRFQHMSNAGLGPSNPGLNMHMVLIGYRF